MKTKRTLTIKMFLMLVSLNYINNIKAQINLVPNPSFEIYDTCPTFAGNLNTVANWRNFGGTPDFYTQCGSNGMSVPYNAAGFQNAANGVSYVGEYTFYNLPGAQNVRELIGVQLLSSLIIGTKYFISFKTSPAYSNSSLCNLFNNNISLLFTNYVIDSSITPNTLNLSHVKYNNIINDTASWTPVTGSFIADSNYSYLVIGNLYDDVNTLVDSSLANQQASTPYTAFYYIDDVCVSTDSLFAWNYQFLFKNNSSSMINVFPNPCQTELTINTSIESNISIVDLRGRTKLNEIQINGEAVFDISSFENGFYLIQIKNSFGSTVKKIIVNH